MIKYIIILMNMLALLLMRMLFPQDLTIKISAPEKVKQGDEFTVEIKISKGTISGIGHFKQGLPVGLGNATVIEAKGADFLYLPKDNALKFTWLSLPADADYTVSYKIKVWLDKDEIRPGDVFVMALEKGIAESRAVALIISPDAMSSGWVKEEYHRALSLAVHG